MLAGYKTHMLVLGGLMTVAGMFFTGELTLAESMQRALEVASISALRMGVSRG